MTKYTIRIDDNGVDTYDRLKDFLDHDRYVRYLIYREVSDKTKKLHYQGFVEISDDFVSWHTGRWCTKFKDYSKGKKSSTVVKKDNYMIYISKDKDLVFSKGCTQDFIDSLQSQSYKKTEKKKDDIFSRFLQYCISDSFIDDKKYSINYIRELLFQFLGSNSEDIEVRRIDYYRSLCFKIQAILIYGSCRDDRYENALNRWLNALS